MSDIETLMQQAINEAKDAQAMTKKAMGFCEELLARVHQLETENKTLRGIV
jgi:hypothetical protein